jgi:death on curing protein
MLCRRSRLDAYSLAFLSIGLFLGLNGYRLAAGQVNALQTIFSLADGTLDESGLSAWIEEQMEQQEL